MTISSNTKRGVFISWSEQNGRTSDLAEALDLEARFIYSSRPLVLRYVSSAVLTFLQMYKGRDRPFLLMLPPTPLMLCGEVARRLFKVTVIYDLHTGFFYDPKWMWARAFSLTLIGKATCIVTNENLAKVCRDHGGEAIVLHDVMSTEPHHVAQKVQGNSTEAGTAPRVIFPASYSNDEPIAAILDAAALLPETQWVLTGNAPAHVRSAATPNVSFTGFLSEVEFDLTIASASVVLALTQRKDTMQRAGYEALMAGVPVVASDFQVLRSFFEDAAVYVEPNGRSIAGGVQKAVRANDVMRQSAAEVLNRRSIEQERALGELRRSLSVVGLES